MFLDPKIEVFYLQITVFKMKMYAMAACSILTQIWVIQTTEFNGLAYYFTFEVPGEYIYSLV